MKERIGMKHLKWYPVGAFLALTLLLSACGADPVEPDTAEPSPPETQFSPLIIDAPTPPAESDPVESDSADELPPEPSAPPMLEDIVGLIPLCEPVEEEWFADAVFIGDSRTDGLKLYGGIKGATYFSYKGLSVFSIDEKECITLDGAKVTALDAVSRGTYGKIFVMLGINEIGYKDLDAFKQAYTDLVIKLKELQPEADIYLQLQPPANEGVAKQKGAYTHVTNERIQLFNTLITEVAEEQQTALLDIWDALVDENGALPADITADGIHMVRAGYQVWADYLRTHTGATPLVIEEPVETESAQPTGTPSDDPEEVASAKPSATPQASPKPQTSAPVVSISPTPSAPVESAVPSAPPAIAPVESAVPSVPPASAPVESAAPSVPPASAPVESAPMESQPVSDDPEAVVSQPAGSGNI